MKNLNFLAVTGCGLLAVFLISFTAACSRQSGAADAPVMQADSSGLQSVGTVDKTENGTADAGQAMDRGGEEAEDTGQVSGNDGGEGGDESLVSGNGRAESGDAGQVSGNDNGESAGENQVSGNTVWRL